MPPLSSEKEPLGAQPIYPNNNYNNRRMNVNTVHFDYEMVLFLILIATSLSWVLHKCIKNTNPKLKKVQRFSGHMAAYFPLVLLVFSFRSFAFEPFRIPSSSMMPTLLTGDFILVDKYSYGIKMPVFHNTLITTGTPERGEVLVFRSVEDPSVDVIKRVIATPGDHVYYDQASKKVFVNDTAYEHLNPRAYQGFLDDISPHGLVEKTETINDEQHQILTTNGRYYPFQFTELTVPEGHYFAMGDNRDNSHDSRSFGLIPEDRIVGKARMIWMHWRPEAFFEGFKRIGTLL